MPQRRKRTYIVAYRNDTPIARTIARPDSWILDSGTIATAFPVSPKVTRHPVTFQIEGTLDEISARFNTEKAKLEFENAGFMTKRKVFTVATIPCYEGERVLLGQLLQPEHEVPDIFFIPDGDLPKWKYLKGSKQEIRKSSGGYEYKYSEGSMAFPDAPDRPSRTIITGEGGSGPSRFKPCNKDRKRTLQTAYPRRTRAPEYVS